MEGVWVWHWNDQPANYTGWGPGEPNSNGDQDCVFINVNENYMWADIQCTNTFRPLCEKRYTFLYFVLFFYHFSTFVM